MKVLVVEDDPDWRIVIKDALDFAGSPLADALAERGIILPGSPQIEVAHNMGEAIEKIEKEKEPFDLVIADLLIPETRNHKADPVSGKLLGYKVVEKVREKFRGDVPIVVYSNFLGSERDNRDRGLLEFLEMLRARDIAPPDEMLWKEHYDSYSLLMKKLIRYAIDLTTEDEAKLKEANILVPPRGATRRVLRVLKRMACSASVGFPRSDVLLLGENGVGKTTFARAYHLLRPRRPDHPHLAFEHLDLGSLDFAGSAPNIALFGATDFNGAWSLGAFVRTTLYKRGEDFLHFAGQELEPGHKVPSLKSFAELGKAGKAYPEPGDQVDFDGSGTLFLDEVVNIGFEVQAMLLQALSYDLHARHVYTTGHAPRRLRVGPSLVFATAQPLQHSEHAQRDEGQFRTMRDYLFRIDQTRVTIPPLREREPFEIIQLLKALVMKRRPKDPAAREIDVDPIIEKHLTTALDFRNNVADLQRIADQVMPEEPTISWQHVGPLFEREQPLIYATREKPRGDSATHDKDTVTYAKARQIYNRYLSEKVKVGQKLPLSRLRDALDITREEAYKAALIFMEECGCYVKERWPKEDETLKVFDHGTKAFQTYLHRLSPYRSGSFSLQQALRDLGNLKTLERDVSE
jgi:DNA-binding NtrC family response regulator